MKRLLAIALLLSACVPDTGRDVVAVPISAAGAGVDTFTTDGFTVTLERADVAIGPLYFCASDLPDFDLCESALFEWLDPFVVDARGGAPVALGAMEGTTGAVRTAFFDYGISWYLTANSPSVGPAALAGHSAVFEGVATRGADVVRFSAAIDVVPIGRGLIAVKGAPAVSDVDGGEAVVVRVDPAALFASVDFDALLATVVDPATPVVVQEGSQAYEAIVFQMTAGGLPAFEWQEP